MMTNFNSQLGQQRLAFRMDEAAQVLGISQATLYRLVKDRQLSTVKIGTRTLVTRTELERLLQKGAESPGHKAT